MNNLNDVLLNVETVQCSHGDNADHQAEFLSLENNAVVRSKKVTHFTTYTSFFVNNKLGFVVNRDRLLRFRR